MTEQDRMKAAVKLRKPLLPKCFLHWTGPPDNTGDETFRLVSWRRNLTLRGSAFQEFEKEVIPLLNGKLDLEDIYAKVADTFTKADLEASFAMLATQGILVEGDNMVADVSEPDRTPQMGWLSETAPGGLVAQEKLRDAHIVLFGAGMHGAVVARALVAAGLGHLSVFDPTEVASSDLYFSGLFMAEDIGKNRAAALVSALRHDGSQTELHHHATHLDDPNELTSLVSGKSLALCCLESGQLTAILNINIACKAAGLPWMAASLEGTSLVVGPGFFHHDTGPCYMCWRLREVAAATNPQVRVAIESHLGAVQSDLSGLRENLAVSADIVGGMLGAEALSWLTGTSMPNLDGRFLQISIPGLRVEKHTVLRKPGCPVCDAMKVQS